MADRESRHDGVRLSNLTISIAASGPPTLGALHLADAVEGSSVGLEQGPMMDELLIAEKAGDIMVGSASINISSIEPADGISSTVHGTMTAHLGVPPGAQYSGMADVNMTF